MTQVDVQDIQALEVDLELIRKLDRSGPRYTSYPTADLFVESFSPDSYKKWASRRDTGAVQRPLSIYVHIPFCNTLCFYCGCNKIITKDKSKAAVYLEYLKKEIAMQSELFADDLEVTQLHWGGGTPTFLSDDQMSELMGAIRAHFRLAKEGEFSIEVDPRKVNAQTIELLGKLGFNRISLGVQDFDPEVQKAVNRIQSEEETLSVIEAARRSGFKSISIDLIYGLPRQTVDGFNRTLDRIIAANPDRLAIYNYAHLPNLFMPQRRINEDELPSADTKLQILSMAIKRMTDAGYLYIGMDHFAKPDDELAVAQRMGRLHRNFQGYSTHADCDLVALGITAIGKVGATYSQNYRTLEEYYESLDNNMLPLMRGLELSADDLLRRDIIQALMCQFALSKQDFEISHAIDFDNYFAQELAELKEYQDYGLVKLDNGSITVTPKGRLLIRNICMTFDKYLRQGKQRKMFSKVI